MSPLLEANFDDVPDEILSIEPGEYAVEIEGTPEILDTKKGTGRNLVVVFRITEDGPFKRRTIKQYIYLSDIGLTTAKQLSKAAGVEVGAGGLQTEELAGQALKIRVVQRPYKNPETGEVEQRSQVGGYVD